MQSDHTNPNIFLVCINHFYTYKDQIAKLNLLEITDEEKDQVIETYLTSHTDEIDEYFATTHIDKAVLKQDVLVGINELYLHALDESDDDSEMIFRYHEIVMSHLFQKLYDYNIRIFFILENTLSDKEFLTLLSIFQKSNITTITPYLDDETFTLATTDHSITRLYAREYDDVENDLAYTVAHTHHMMYAEKDTSVSYIHRVLKVAEELPATYLVLYRNKPADIAKGLFLQGYFKEVSFEGK